MTIVSGVRIVAAPCCGAHYAAPRYRSMNFMAFEYWTDGWREGSLMPNDEGLRRCTCGQFILMKETIGNHVIDQDFRVLAILLDENKCALPA